MTLALNLNYVHGESIGYGRFGINLAAALSALGVEVYDDMPQPDWARRDHEDPVGHRRGRCHVVCWVSTPTHARGWWSDQYPVISTMWEASQLPESFRENLHNFAKVLVPSNQNLELFSRYHPDVEMVPLGVDPKVWRYVPRTPPDATFRFLIGGSGPRKGTDVAYKAFRAAFPDRHRDGPTPVLVMKNPRAEPFYGPNIEIISGRIPAEAEIDLYASAHCYLQPSRGEGFGLQPLQAMAQGCPTVLTAAHGHDSFAHLGLGISAALTKSAYFIYGDAGDWWEPNFDELVDQMRWVYDNYDQAVVDAAISAEVIADDFTWENTARRTVVAIGTDQLETSPGDGDWFTPEARLYSVVTNRDWKCDVAGTSYYFRKGVEYRESADVKRILHEAEILDPVCLDGTDTGLAPSQVAELAAYSAKHSFCPTCHQQLNTQPTRADVEEATCR